jgi:hypothetical protein
MRVAFTGCGCLDQQYESRKWCELRLHSELQDTTCDGWKRLLDLVELAVHDGRELFAPGRLIPYDEWMEVVTLPPTIAKLKAVKHLMLYGSNLVRIPPEIGEMTALEAFTPYTSYRLHYFPFEITRCPRLKESTVSTRVLYGNYKYRPPFPQLPQISSETVPRTCSVCARSFPESGPEQFWVSLRVATDVVPLLVHACCLECVRRVPKSCEGYVAEPHQGGLELKQPESSYWL